MKNRTSFSIVALLLLAVLVIAVGAGLVALVRIDSWGERGNGLSPRFTYDLEPYQKTDPALIGYTETARIDLTLQDPRAVAVGPDDRIYVAGDRAIQVLAADGRALREIKVPGEPRCLAVAGPHHAQPGRIFLGRKEHVETYDAEGQREGAWESLGPAALLTSIAVDDNDVYVANAGGRIVLRYDTSGKLLGRIGARDEARGIPGFVIPSPCFDVALAPDGLVRVVNPGAHAVQAYTADGDLEASWGKATLEIRGFCGCCNPAAIAILPDGRVATAEKGIPRVKLYTAEGEFVCVVAGPESLLPTATAAEETRNEHKLKILDLAADSRGRILVLDPTTRSVRVYEQKKS